MLIAKETVLNLDSVVRPASIVANVSVCNVSYTKNIMKICLKYNNLNIKIDLLRKK